MILLIYLLCVFFIGSIPFGFLIGKFWLKIDIRKKGSGNIGMTNLMRIGGKWPGLATFFLDFLKGFLVIEYIKLNNLFIDNNLINQNLTLIIVGITCILGHIFSIFLKFKGGKGISTLFGFLFSFDVLIGILSSLVWIIMFLFRKISSLSALTTLFFIPWFYLIVQKFRINTYLWFEFFIIFALCSLLIYKHQKNIKDLILGKEYKFKS